MKPSKSKLDWLIGLLAWLVGWHRSPAGWLAGGLEPGSWLSLVEPAGWLLAFLIGSAALPAGWLVGSNRAPGLVAGWAGWTGRRLGWLLGWHRSPAGWPVGLRAGLVACWPGWLVGKPTPRAKTTRQLIFCTRHTCSLTNLHGIKPIGIILLDIVLVLDS